MSRQHVEFVEAFEVIPEEITAGGLTGTIRRELSVDDDTDESTSLVSFPAAWSGSVAGSYRSVELFCLRGAITVDGSRLTPGCYTYISAAAGSRAATSDGAVVLVMANALEPGKPTEESSLEVLDVNAMEWESVRSHLGDRPGRAEGIVLKLLRVDPVTGAWSWVSAVPPQWRAGYAEVHPTVEECLQLRGDVLLGTCGAMRAGSYFYRPGMIPHGPMYSHTGAMWFFRTNGGSLATEYVDVPGWERLVDDYVSSLDFFGVADPSAG